MPDEKIIDLDAIESLRALSPDGGGDFLRELIDMYLQDMPERLVELERALSANDTASFTRAAHTIKGSSSNFGAQRLSRVAQTIEQHGKSGALSAAAPLCATVRTEFNLVAQALTALAKTP
jgi:HPt (histidine-containing phosphotransfer) domain-containing protein